MLAKKTDHALRTIGEVAEILSVPSHVIRFWEGKFLHLKPVKYNGRRYYSPENISFLKQIKELLYNQEYSIKAAISYLAKPRTLVAPHVLLNVKEKLLQARKKLSKLLPNIK